MTPFVTIDGLSNVNNLPHARWTSFFFLRNHKDWKDAQLMEHMKLPFVDSSTVHVRSVLLTHNSPSGLRQRPSLVSLKVIWNEVKTMCMQGQFFASEGQPKLSLYHMEIIAAGIAGQKALETALACAG